MAGNKALARTYFPDRRQALFDYSKAALDADWKPYPGLSTKKAVDIAFFLLRTEPYSVSDPPTHHLARALTPGDNKAPNYSLVPAAARWLKMWRR